MCSTWNSRLEVFDEAPPLVPLNLALLLLTLVRYTGGGATAIRRDYYRFAGLARDACERLFVEQTGD